MSQRAIKCLACVGQSATELMEMLCRMEQEAHVAATPRRTYTILVIPDEDGFMVEVPALPGCFTQGPTADAAIERAKEAIRVHIAGLEADGEPVPDEANRRPILTLVSV